MAGLNVTCNGAKQGADRALAQLLRHLLPPGECQLPELEPVVRGQKPQCESSPAAVFFAGRTSVQILAFARRSPTLHGGHDRLRDESAAVAAEVLLHAGPHIRIRDGQRHAPSLSGLRQRERLPLVRFHTGHPVDYHRLVAGGAYHLSASGCARPG